jgi:ankyrin repeat protein
VKSLVEDYLQNRSEGDEDLVNSPGASDRRPLHRAAGSNQVEICEYLLSKGALVDIQDSAGRTPIIWAALNSNENVVTLLATKARANLQLKTTESGTTALHISAENGKVAIVKTLLTGCKEGEPSTQSQRVQALLDEKCAKGKTALEYAKDKRHQPVIKLINEVEKGLKKGSSDGGDSNVCNIQ